MDLLFENGVVHNWVSKPDFDYTMNVVDIARAKTFEMRFRRLGLDEKKRKVFVMLAVMKKKHSGLVYSDEIEKELKTLLII
jgi:hypothetical protein